MVIPTSKQLKTSEVSVSNLQLDYYGVGVWSRAHALGKSEQREDSHSYHLSPQSHMWLSSPQST